MAPTNTLQMAWHPDDTYEHLATAKGDLFACINALYNDGKLLKLPRGVRDRILASTDGKAVIGEQIDIAIKQVASSPSSHGVSAVLQDIALLAAQPGGPEESFDYLRSLAYEVQRATWDTAYEAYCEAIYESRHWSYIEQKMSDNWPPYGYFSELTPDMHLMGLIDTALLNGIKSYQAAVRQAQSLLDSTSILHDIADDIELLDSVDVDDELYGSPDEYGHEGPDHARFYLLRSTAYLKELHRFQTAEMIAERVAGARLPLELTEMIRDYICGEPAANIATGKQAAEAWIRRCYGISG